MSNNGTVDRPTRPIDGQGGRNGQHKDHRHHLTKPGIRRMASQNGGTFSHDIYSIVREAILQKKEPPPMNARSIQTQESSTCAMARGWQSKRVDINYITDKQTSNCARSNDRRFIPIRPPPTASLLSLPIGIPHWQRP